MGGGGGVSTPYILIALSVDTDYMTEASEKSKRNRPYLQHNISEHLAIEKTICNRKK